MTDDATRQAEIRARAQDDWRPIETAPRLITRALVYWPTFALGEDFEQSAVPMGDGLVAEGFRVGGNQWESDIVTEHFEDEAGFGYGDPTHWRPMPSPPDPAGATTPAEGAPESAPTSSSSSISLSGKATGSATDLDNRFGDTLKYTAAEDRPCAVCRVTILKGSLCYRYGNWKGDEPHTFQHLSHVDSAATEADVSRLSFRLHEAQQENVCFRNRLRLSPRSSRGSGRR